MQNMSTLIVLSTLGTDLDQHVILPTQGTLGGVLVAWKGAVIQAITTKVDEFSISVLFTMNGRQSWFFGVFGPQADARKVQFLQEMHMI